MEIKSFLALLPWLKQIAPESEEMMRESLSLERILERSLCSFVSMTEDKEEDDEVENKDIRHSKQSKSEEGQESVGNCKCKPIKKVTKKMDGKKKKLQAISFPLIKEEVGVEGEEIGQTFFPFEMLLGTPLSSEKEISWPASLFIRINGCLYLVNHTVIDELSFPKEAKKTNSSSHAHGSTSRDSGDNTNRGNKTSAREKSDDVIIGCHDVHKPDNKADEFKSNNGCAVRTSGQTLKPSVYLPVASMTIGSLQIQIAFPEDDQWTRSFAIKRLAVVAEKLISTLAFELMVDHPHCFSDEDKAEEKIALEKKRKREDAEKRADPLGWEKIVCSKLSAWAEALEVCDSILLPTLSHNPLDARLTNSKALCFSSASDARALCDDNYISEMLNLFEKSISPHPVWNCCLESAEASLKQAEHEVFAELNRMFCDSSEDFKQRKTDKGDSDEAENMSTGDDDDLNPIPLSQYSYDEKCQMFEKFDCKLLQALDKPIQSFAALMILPKKKDFSKK